MTSDPALCGAVSFRTAQDARERARRDWLLPGISGIELTKGIRQQQKPLPILMLTAKDSMEDKIAGLDAGADDYLVKLFDMPELLARLRALQRRTPQLQPKRLKVGNLSLDYASNTFWLQEESGEKQVLLTKKEFQLLEYFMQYPEQILTSEQLLDRLWEFGAEPPSNVVAALDTIEDWEIVNVETDGMEHPFHLHVNPFQIVSRNGKPESYRAWKDTILIGSDETVRIRIPFRDFAGKTVYHCHILDHEDLGMMGNLEIIS